MKTRRFITLIATALFALLGSEASAKRPAPAEVQPVVFEGIEYRAPHSIPYRDKMGVVEAWDKAKMLWEKKVYTTEINPALEKDVQDVFITKLEISEGKLIVTNERNERFSIDLKTREVTALGKK